MKKEMTPLSKLNHTENLNNLADFLLLETNTDVRLNTNSRAGGLPKLRFVFFNIYLHVYNISLADLGSFLDKDHALVQHSKGVWENQISKEFLHLLIKYKDYKKLSTTKERKKLTDYELILKLQDEVQLLNNELITTKIDFETYKKNTHVNIKNDTIRKLLSLDEETINFFCETRLKPFLRMNKSKITNQDLIKVQQNTRKM